MNNNFNPKYDARPGHATEGMDESSGKDRGMYHKYLLFHADGTPVEGDYFVLKPEKDKAARAAMFAYGLVTENKELSKDIMNWMRRLNPVFGAVTEFAKKFRDDAEQLHCYCCMCHLCQLSCKKCECCKGAITNCGDFIEV